VIDVTGLVALTHYVNFIHRVAMELTRVGVEPEENSRKMIQKQISKKRPIDSGPDIEEVADERGAVANEAIAEIVKALKGSAKKNKKAVKKKQGGCWC